MSFKRRNPTLKYLSHDPMFFGPPRVKDDSAGILYGVESDMDSEKRCDHQGKKHVFNGETWRCECGARL